MLFRSRVAVWDVCERAYRTGSLDTSIVRDSIVVNDFASFFERHRRVALLCFNGATAEALYRRFVLPGLGARAARIPALRLPSTSPAHAALPFAAKLDAWAPLAAAAGPTRGGRA